MILQVHHLRERVLRLSRSTKRLLMLTADVLMIPFAFWSAMLLKSGRPPALSGDMLLMSALALAFSIPVFVRLGLYRAIVRFIGSRGVIAVIEGVTFASVMLALVTVLLEPAGITLSTLVIFWALALLYVGGSRFLVRNFLHHQQAGTRERVAIYGAGEAGVRLAAALSGGQDFVPIAFIDDSRAIQGSVINGIEVHAPRELTQLITDLGISRVLLALPSVPRRQRLRILKRLEALKVRVQTMPNITDLVSGRAQVDEIREVDVADLLGRDTVPPREDLLEACIRGKSVLVTGAGGSIGSELCRQIIRCGPARLVLLEISEPSLYAIERDLRSIARLENLSADVISLLGSVHHKNRMREIMRSFSVDTVYHAAAYKHVPIVEENMIEGIYNNVFGTRNTAEAAAEAGCETFVLVSTDKAVMPPNVMGATKRVAELVLQAAANQRSRTRFCMVRFGNVLDSSGSVVPLFREQIRQGGPVTVTHPEIIRYFMTIPEAAQLVIQAGALAKGGDVFVLDMGEPVKIADLARRMIHLMGLTVRDEDDLDGDIEIHYTGLRPAEKLYEELLISDKVMGTGHPMIMRAVEESLPAERVEELLDRLLAACQRFDCDSARSILLEAVKGYRPEGPICDLVHARVSQSIDAGVKAGKVAEIHTKRIQN